MEQKTLSGKRFAPKRSLFIPATLFLLNLSLILVFQTFRKFTPVDISDWVAIGLWLFFLGYYGWKWRGTHYELRNGTLIYRSGFTRGSIPINRIHKIETQTRSWANVNATLASKGMMITYNKWDELFISPKDETGFLEALLQENPAIQVRKPADKQPALP
ncbi:PH domain-containing protein [Adhaeribacter sp. BT258]|uniref:PH domain-containing protein n=1 Tax=Adhaeribacter terrigena TaxID=2793070 RepID=A0ABS1C4A9_9BACT|nr:PH domain-containing protein [Adhaeribacter terrigena]MBK0403458.1 PH domain-containing protein [Adhaeribacter terrigena]